MGLNKLVGSGVKSYLACSFLLGFIRHHQIQPSSFNFTMVIFLHSSFMWMTCYLLGVLYFPSLPLNQDYIYIIIFGLKMWEFLKKIYISGFISCTFSQRNYLLHHLYLLTDARVLTCNFVSTSLETHSFISRRQ